MNKSPLAATFGSPWKLESDEDMSVLVHSLWPLYFFDGWELCLRVRLEGFRFSTPL
jgi:hypothetical protein